MVRISNAIPTYDGDELNISPAAQKHIDVWALVDTGATMTVIDLPIQRELMLPQQASTQFLFPNSGLTEHCPTYTCSFSLHEHYSPGSKMHEWQDWLEVAAFPLEARSFRAVIGMDILSVVELQITKGLPQLTY